MSDLKNVLLIDDEKDICDVMADLMQDSGYKAITAIDGVEGIRKYGNQKFDLVITDLKMPKKSGLEVIKAIREKDKKNATTVTPVVVLSGNIDVYKPELAMIENLHLFHKPFDQDELKLLVNSLLQDKKLVYDGPKKAGDDLLHLVSSKINEVLSIIIKVKGDISKQTIKKGPKVVAGNYIIQNAYTIDKVRGRIIYSFEGDLGDELVKLLRKGKDVEAGGPQAFQTLHLLAKALVTKTTTLLTRKYKSVKTGKLHLYGSKLYVSDDEEVSSLSIKTKYGKLNIDNAFTK